MKRIILSAVLLLACYTTALRAQMVINIVNPNESMKADSIDDVRFAAQYLLKFVPDPANPENILDETMMLKVGTKASEYYSYNRFVTDSLFREELKRNNGQINRQRTPGDKTNEGMVTHRIYKNYPAGKVTTLDQVASGRFRCEETNVQPEWELLDDVTIDVIGYPCQKAVCHFKGRDWTVWYTLDIPRSEGPWKLFGLPGLILKAEDSQKHYVFECTGLINQTGQPMMFGAEGYQKVSRKDLFTVYERFAADPVGYITSTNPNVKIVIKNEDGVMNTTPKNTPYNPIELSEK